MCKPNATITAASRPFLYDFTVTRGSEPVPYRAFLHERCRYPWFRRAAEQGSTDAQTLLENMPQAETQGDVQLNPLSDIELYIAGRIAESLDEPEYSFMER